MNEEYIEFLISVFIYAFIFGLTVHFFGFELMVASALALILANLMSMQRKGKGKKNDKQNNL